MQVDGVPMYQLCMKLRPVKDVFKRQNLVCFGDLKHTGSRKRMFLLHL